MSRERGLDAEYPDVELSRSPLDAADRLKIEFGHLQYTSRHEQATQTLHQQRCRSPLGERGHTVFDGMMMG